MRRDGPCAGMPIPRHCIVKHVADVASIGKRVTARLGTRKGGTRKGDIVDFEADLPIHSQKKAAGLRGLVKGTVANPGDEVAVCGRQEVVVFE